MSIYSVRYITITMAKHSLLLPQVEFFCYAATFMEHLHAILRPIVDLPPLLTRNEVKSGFLNFPELLWDPYMLL